MAISAAIMEMLGEDLGTAVDAAQARLGDETITARCVTGLWLIERAGDSVVVDLTYEEAITQLESLT